MRLDAAPPSASKGEARSAVGAASEATFETAEHAAVLMGVPSNARLRMSAWLRRVKRPRRPHVSHMRRLTGSRSLQAPARSPLEAREQNPISV
jgi:hypothetical protein